MLELKNIDKSYEIRKDKYQVVLKQLNIQFSNTGFVTILGSSGNGKTTLLNMIAGLDYPDAGEILYNEEHVSDYEAFRREKVGIVFQEFNLIDHLNAVDNVILSMPDKQTHKKDQAKKILTLVGLEDSFYKNPKQMSGGQKQRVAIARMIAKDVDVIICDEPTGSLDGETEIKIVELIKELSKEKLVIFVTHNEEIANKYSDRVIHIKDGQALETDDIKDLSHAGHVEAKKQYKKNNWWLALKNLLGRYRQKLKYLVLTVFILFVASLAIVMESEVFKKYMHEINLDKGVNNILLKLEEGADYEQLRNQISELEAVDFVSYNYSYRDTIDIAVQGYQLSSKVTETRLEAISGNDYFKEILVAGRYPEESHEVIMTGRGVVQLLAAFDIGGERLLDQYATGELDIEYVLSLVNTRKFIVAEYREPKIIVVGLLDENKLNEIYYEEPEKTVYFIDGFTDLFEYPGGLKPASLKIYKDDLYREAHLSIIDEAVSKGELIVDEIHEKKLNVVYNKIDSFLELSKFALLVIVVIAMFSFISLMSTSLFERKYEIGLYRSIGYNKRNISRILGIEMLSIGFTALLVVLILLVIGLSSMFSQLSDVNSFTDIIGMMNLGYLALSQIFILLFIISTIIFIGNRSILSQTILVNIKDV